MINQFTDQTFGYRARCGLRLAASSLLIALLSACGGDSGGSSSGAISVPTQTATPTPTPTPSSSGAGQVASVDLGTVPVAADDDLSDYKVSNTGLYMRVDYAAANKPAAVIKLRGTPAFSDAWYTLAPNTAAGARLNDYAPTNIYSETRSGVSFYWSGYTSEGGGKDRWGLAVANTGDISSTVDQTGAFGYYGIHLVAAGARSGVAASRPWIHWYQPTTIGISGYKIFQDDGQYTSANTITDRFSVEATPGLPDDADIMLSHPDKGELYVGVGNQLFIYSATQRTQSFTLAETGSIYDMTWVNGTLYFGQGTRIYKTTGGAPQQVASLGLPMSAPGRFCISGGEIFLTTGEAINLTTNVKRNWLQKGTLTTTQSAQAAQLLGAVGGGAGVYCSSYATQTVIYVPGITDKTVRAITPVAP